MVNDPYAVLGVSKDATKDEIKKAYRTLAKKYHPDLHPDDPVAAKKMNEVNEAYDMLTNPEKYARERARQGYSQGGYDPFGRTGNAQNGYNQRGYSQQGYNQQGYSQQGYRNNQSGPGGWSTSYWGFDFEDLFGFYDTRGFDTKPKPENGDTNELVKAISLVNQGSYDEALLVLSRMTSLYRNARWHYVSAIAYYGIHDYERATDMIQRAMRLDPNNRVYQQLYRQYQGANRSQYSGYTTSYTSPFGMFGMFGKLLVGFFVFQFIMSILRLLFFGFL